MPKNNIEIKNKAGLMLLRSMLESDGKIEAKNNELAINFAINFAAKYYSIQEYGEPEEIERQIYNKGNETF